LINLEKRESLNNFHKLFQRILLGPT